MTVKLSFDERKWLLKCYWKVKNVLEVQRCWRVEFGTPPSTRVTITRIRDKFDVDGMVQDVLKGRCGRKINAIDNESDDAVMQVFARSLKSLMQYSREIGIAKSSVHRISWAQNLYSISNNPDGMSLCSTKSLGLYCGTRWTFRKCTGLRNFNV